MKGQQAIGTLVIFIALVITAALASFVLVSTTNALQSKSLAVAGKTQETFTRTLQISDLQGWADTGTDGKFNYVLFRVKLGPGSSTIDLKDLRIELEAAGGQKYDYYDYNGAHYAYVAPASLGSTADDAVYVDANDNGSFDAGEELKNFTNQFFIVKNRSLYDTTDTTEPDDYLETGEEYIIAVYFPSGIQESEDIRITITGKNMGTARIDRITPDVIRNGTIVRYE